LRLQSSIVRLEKLLPEATCTSKYSPADEKLGAATGSPLYWARVKDPKPVPVTVVPSFVALHVVSALAHVPLAELVVPDGGKGGGRGASETVNDTAKVLPEPSNPTARQRVADAHATPLSPPPPKKVWTSPPLTTWPVFGSTGTVTAPSGLYPTAKHRAADGHAAPSRTSVSEMVWAL
jgi:hypothetical protein